MTDVFARQLGLGATADHFAQSEEGEAVCNQFGMHLVMRDEDDRDIAALAHAHHGLQHFHLLLLTQSRGRLIKDQNFRAEIDRARNGQGLTLSA